MFDDGLNSIVVIILIVLIVALAGIPIRNTWGLRFLDDIKENAPTFLESNGFKVIGYQGYQTNTFYGTAKVWWTVEKDTYLYECAVKKINGEYHLYNLEVKSPVNISSKTNY